MKKPTEKHSKYLIQYRVPNRFPNMVFVTNLTIIAGMKSPSEDYAKAVHDFCIKNTKENQGVDIVSEEVRIDMIAFMDLHTE